MRADLHEVGLGRVCFSGSRLGRAFGHDIITDKDGVTRYCDDLSVLDRNNLRPCVKCGGDPNKTDGHDPCIAGLPGVRNACCGHGIDEAYIEFDDGRVAHGEITVSKRTG